jgi:hypothetical protein
MWVSERSWMSVMMLPSGRRTGKLSHQRLTSYVPRCDKSALIEEPRSKLRGMFCRAAVLRIDRKEFYLI